MRTCPDCHVTIATETKRCPLCHRLLPEATEKGIQSYPELNVKTTRRAMMLKIESTVALTAIFASVLVNILTYVGHLWSVVVVAAILYAWIVGGWLTFKRNVHLSLKLVVHAVSLTILLLIVEAFTTSSTINMHLQWTLSYAMPSLFIAFIVAINILMIAKRQHLRDFLLSQFSLSIIGFTPLILVFCHLVHPFYMSVAAGCISFATIIGLFIFARRIVISELERKFFL